MGGRLEEFRELFKYKGIIVVIVLRIKVVWYGG